MRASLVMFKADGQRREFPLTKPKTTLGRKHDCDLRIPLSAVSREHCQISLKGNELKLRDLGSSNGTFRNDERVTEVTLEPGDTITIGPVHFTVVINGVPSDIEPVRTVLPAGSEEVQAGGGSGVAGAAAAGAAAAAAAKPAAPKAPAKPAPPAEEDDELPVIEEIREDEEQTITIGSADDEDEDESRDDDPLAALQALVANGDEDEADEDAPVFTLDDDEDNVPLFEDDDDKK